MEGDQGDQDVILVDVGVEIDRLRMQPEEAEQRQDTAEPEVGSADEEFIRALKNSIRSA